MLQMLMDIMGQVEEDLSTQLPQNILPWQKRQHVRNRRIYLVVVHLVTNQESCGTSECVLLNVCSVIVHTSQGKPLHAFCENDMCVFNEGFY